jgi:hypothetical protein
MSDEAKLVPIYTTASYVLDLPNTEVLVSQAGSTATGRRVRMVGVLADEVARQTAQYVSNLETALNEHEWKCELQFGNVSETAGDHVAA